MRFRDFELIWSNWIELESKQLSETIKNQPGIYKIKRTNQKSLDYVGQTNSLRRRLLSFRRHLFDKEMPWSDPHVAAARFWALRQDEDFNLEVSVANISNGELTRRAFECLTISQHRKEFHLSPTFNFGRMPNGWSASSQRRKGIRGSRNTTIKYSPHFKTLFSEKSDPLTPDWLGLEWRSFSNFPPTLTSKGVYRGFNKENLIYIGESKKIKTRINSHINKGIADNWDWVELPDTDHAQRLEIENDLISSYILNAHEPPKAQFNQDKN